VPDEVFHELESQRVEGDPHVFAAYTTQLRHFYEGSTRPGTAKIVNPTFDPTRLGDWFYERVVGWAETQPGGHAYIHTFRKTGFQFTRSGEDLNRRVAEDACVSEKVMLNHYVTERDPELRAKSNRTFERLAAALPPAVAVRFGYLAPQEDPLEEKLREATERKDWDLVGRLSSELRSRRQASAG
jgi:hypothetical protein